MMKVNKDRMEETLNLVKKKGKKYERKIKEIEAKFDVNQGKGKEWNQKN